MPALLIPRTKALVLAVGLIVSGKPAFGHCSDLVLNRGAIFVEHDTGFDSEREPNAPESCLMGYTKNFLERVSPGTDFKLSRGLAVRPRLVRYMSESVSFFDRCTMATGQTSR